MDIIITEPVVDQMIETACLTSYYLDVELGTKESRAKNDFEIKMSLDEWKPSMNQGSFVLSDLFCGQILKLEIDTQNQEVSLYGFSIQKLLDSKIIVPQNGTHYEMEADANTIIAQLVNPCFSNVIIGSNLASGFHIHLKARYDTIFEALEKSLAKVGARLQFVYNGSQIVVSAVSVNHYPNVELSNDYDIGMVASAKRGYNHIIALGRGEMEERTVIELYYENGKVSDNAIPEGINRYTYLYDFSGIESDEQLYSEAEKKLLSICDHNSLTLKLDGAFEIGDRLQIKERISGIQAEAYVHKKIIRGTYEDLNIEYKVGD